MTTTGNGQRKLSGKAPPRRDVEERAPEAAAPEAAKDRLQRIAEAAYYNAERRGFAGGFEVEDWLEAERQVDSAPNGERVKATPSRRRKPGSRRTTDR